MNEFLDLSEHVVANPCCLNVLVDAFSHEVTVSFERASGSCTKVYESSTQFLPHLQDFRLQNFNLAEAASLLTQAVTMRSHPPVTL